MCSVASFSGNERNAARTNGNCGNRSLSICLIASACFASRDRFMGLRLGARDSHVLNNSFPVHTAGVGAQFHLGVTQCLIGLLSVDFVLGLLIGNGSVIGGSASIPTAQSIAALALHIGERAC